MWEFYDRIKALRIHFRGRFAYLGRQSTARILRDLLRQELTLDPAVQARVDRFAESHFGQQTVGVHVRSMIWTVLYRHTEDAVTLNFASTHYDPADYIRDYDEFQRLVAAGAAR